MSAEKFKHKIPKHVVPPFLKRLQMLVAECPVELGGWNDNGTAFFVHCENVEFETLVLKTHFKGGIASFVRQLHFYGFKKIEHNTQGRTTGFGFRHEHFLRDSPHLIFVIKRKTKTDSLGSDAVFTAADLKGVKNQLEYIRCRTAEMTETLDTYFHDAVGMSFDDVRMDPQPFRLCNIKTALEEIERATLKQGTKLQAF